MSIARNGVNNTVRKPEIYLRGATVKGNFYSRQVDNSIHTYPSTGSVFYAKTQFDEDDILSFNNEVRIIITGQMDFKPTYQPKLREGNLEDLSFEGNVTYNASISNVNEYAETWFTFNKKEPIRTAANFYSFTDMDDREISHNPSDPHDNLDSLGFLLKTSPTGSPLITLKARTYFRGEVSRTAVAIFKLIYPLDENKVYQNTWATS